MIYRIRQLTKYTYASTVPFARHVLRLKPVSGPGQTVRLSTIAIDPMPHERSETDDFFGNRITQIAVELPHETLSVASEAEVEVTAPPPLDAATTPPWEEIRAAAASSASLGPRSPVHQIFPSRLVPIVPAIRGYAATSFPAGRPVLEGGVDLMARIKADFAYDSTATDVTTPTADAFALKRGVCQDFAHVMIAGLRALGLPAAYVSGYLRTEPAPGRPRLEGADATHAWVSLWCGDAAGWQGLDPTNNVRAGADHVTLAFGRDYADVSPVDGVIVASGGHSLDVSVDVGPQPA
ncbi:MAG: transglutaminase family protein [Candidatus Eiseniibacteriota bacterium]